MSHEDDLSASRRSGFDPAAALRRFAPPKVRNYLSGAVAVLIFFGGLMAWEVYHEFLVDVPREHIAILIKKDGADIDNTDEIAPDAEHRGIQRAFLTEGRYFRNPYNWEWEIVPQIVIPEGQMGIQISLSGDDLPNGEFLAHLGPDGQPTTKGVVPGVLRPGRYQVHTYLFKIDDNHKPVTVPAGFVGVQTNLAGPLAPDPNRFLVPTGFRGVDAVALQPGTYYVNPFETRIHLVDCRSQRFNLANNNDMGFPSKDGFWVSLDGIIEFRIKPEKASEVYVIYNERKNGDAVNSEIVDKIILPSARSFCRLYGSNESGRDFIQGETRTRFQEEFQKAMRASCDPLGIEIIQALITKIRPPQKIAKPVREREIAKQQELQFREQILQQESQQKLAIETELVKQKEGLVKADQEVIKLTTQSKREQQVALTKANQDLKVAQFKFQAAQDEAAAIMSRGKAAAEIVKFQNEAEAAGWKQSVLAFGDGASYARYTLYRKLAPSYRDIMANTKDSPIMKIFETFTAKTAATTRPPSKPNEPEVAPKRKPATSSPPAPRVTELKVGGTKTSQP